MTRAYTSDGLIVLREDNDQPLDIDALSNPGTPGASARIRFRQDVPLATWTIDDAYTGATPPNVSVAVQEGSNRYLEVNADIEYLEDQKRILIHFYAPVAGVAYLS